MGIERFETMDSNILLSMVNMKLRDEFSSLDSLIKFYDIDKDKLIAKLAEADFEYLESVNQFR
ncbi:hypothetical protein A9264_08160 [Vibrio sp. UCD-FRSSP16_10]|uniref:DUF4250 domain-containing protein n=1 Tax=unclassified Vibrio TaxID=2614977 RepID=UPI000801946E|nr:MULTISPECIES: DUF4250 domain-containing protein [unclassified Vibrio]OBT06538.1 hypothetical protein A9260_08945 [Vibrio sp. UCD-FRSSP16_30]OBT12235.1 hypothetical protein A9264_08160 [Vibrio sp. UCD-FRSSP16_10]